MRASIDPKSELGASLSMPRLQRRGERHSRSRVPCSLSHDSLLTVSWSISGVAHVEFEADGESIS